MSDIEKTKTGKPMGNYKVGYRRPPADSKWKKGKSGNPRGRTPKKPPNLDDIVRAQLDEKVPVRIGESTQMLSAREALLIKARTDAFKSGPREVKAYFELVERFAPNALEPHSSHSSVKPRANRPARLVWPDSPEVGGSARENASPGDQEEEL